MKHDPGEFDLRHPDDLGGHGTMSLGSSRRLVIGMIGVSILLGLMLLDASRSWDRSGGNAPTDRRTGAPAPAVGTGTTVSESAQACGQGGGSATGPRPIGNVGAWITPDDYPVSALRLSQQGVSAALLQLDSAGGSARAAWIAAAAPRRWTSRPARPCRRAGGSSRPATPAAALSRRSIINGCAGSCPDCDRSRRLNRQALIRRV